MKKCSLIFSCFFVLLLSGCYNSKKTVYSDLIKKQYRTKPIVVIDAGHGNFDLGTHNDLCEEKNLTLATAHFVKQELMKKGYRVIMTRSTDEFITLKKRAQIANDMKSQLLVSIHYNAAHNKKAHGIEIFYQKKAQPWKEKRSKLLAQTILKNMLIETGASSRGIKEGNLCVIRESNMPSILIECGFITNKEECKKMINPEYQKKIAKAISIGIDQYFSL